MILCPNRNARIIGWLISAALLGAAGYTIWNRLDEISTAIESIEKPNVWWIIALALIMVMTIVVVSESFLQLLGRRGIAQERSRPIERDEMFWVIAVASVMNWLPLRAGLVGRTVYHSKVHGIPATKSLQVLIEIVVISIGTACGALLLLAIGNAMGFHPLVMLASPALIIIPFACLHCSNRWLIAIICRYFDVLLLALRYWIIFSLMGYTITAETAIILAGAGSIASLLPLPTGGLGGREWIIGLIASWVTVFPGAIALGLLGDLINRLIELVVIVPLGLIGQHHVKNKLTNSNPTNK